jgi:hypothetical protein
VIVREVLPDELPGVGALRVRAYTEQGLLSAASGYVETLRALGADRDWRPVPDVALLAFGLRLD